MSEIQLRTQVSVHSLPYNELSVNQKLHLVGEILKNSFPNCAGYAFGPALNLINVYFLSKYGDDKIVAGYGLGRVYVMAFALAMVLSLNQAAGVLMAQAFGAKNYRALGLYFQKNIVLMSFALIPVMFLLMISDKVMVLFSIDRDLAELTGTFARLSIPSVFGMACFDILRSFITSQKVFYPIIYVQIVNLILHWCLAKLLIDWLHLGVEGAAICRGVEEFINAFLLYIYIKKSRRFEMTWIPWTTEALDKKSLMDQIKFSIPTTAINYANWLYYEVMTLLSGIFGAKYVVTHVAMANTSAVGYTISLGVGVTVTTYAANAVGKQSSTEAKNYFYTGMIIICIFAVTTALSLLSLRQTWASFWTNDMDTQAYLVEVLFVFCGTVFWSDSLNNVQLGLLKSIGKQKEASFIVSVSAYIIGFPLMLAFTFLFDLKVRGLWLAFGLSKMMITGWSLLSISRVDWQEVLDASMARLKENEKDLELKVLSRAHSRQDRKLLDSDDLNLVE